MAAPWSSIVVYAVWAYRYAETRGYNFPVGAYADYDQAVRAADRHRKFRGFKYDHKIYELPLGFEFDCEEAKLVRDFINPP